MFVAGKLRMAFANNHRRGPSTSRYKPFAQDDSLLEEVKDIWLGVQDHQAIEKVTGSQDDDFVGHAVGLLPVVVDDDLVRSFVQVAAPELLFILRLLLGKDVGHGVVFVNEATQGRSMISIHGGSRRHWK
jgi:hypothetical protein